MNSSVQKIKERLSIEEVVSTYIKLEKAGANLKAKCPFHNEKTPSFFISPDRGSYYCFGCGASGDIFTFVEEFEGLDFKGALKLLADRAGVQLEVYSKEMKVAESEKEKLYRAMEEATKFFENNLRDNTQALEYLKSRGLNEKSIKDFRIGFIENDWRLLYESLKNKFSDLELEKAGLIKKTEKGFYDRFRGRIMFPISDSSGRIIAFSGRIFTDDPSTSSGQVIQAKYLNSPDTPIFKKSSILYGLDKAKQSIRKNDFSIVVEGQMDLILSHQAGFKNTVATSGTALVESDKLENNVINNLGVISRLSQNIVFIFDADKAGFAASIRATPIAMALFSDMNVKATQIPEGMDPADLISQKGPDAWRGVIRNSKHIIEFLLDKILINKNNDILKIKLEINDKIIPFLSLINNSVKKSHFISLISNKSGISENDIREKLKKVEQELNISKKEMEEIKVSGSQIFRKDYIERKLLGIAFWKKDKKLEKSLSEILEKYKDSKNDLIFEAEVFYGNSENLEKDIKELLNNLEEERINEELLRKMQELRIIKDKDREIKLLEEIQELNKQKHEKKK